MTVLGYNCLEYLNVFDVEEDDTLNVIYWLRDDKMFV